MLLLDSFLPLEDLIDDMQYMLVGWPSVLSGLDMSIVDVRCRDSRGKTAHCASVSQVTSIHIRRGTYAAIRIILGYGPLCQIDDLSRQLVSWWQDEDVRRR